MLNVPIEYRDVRVLHTGDEVDLVNDFNLNDDIDNLTELVLPTARLVRLTLRAVCEEKADNEEYYGVIDEAEQAPRQPFWRDLSGHCLQPVIR